MKVSHAVPSCLLTASPEFNDYDYCLTHLLDQDEDYYNTLKMLKKQVVILSWIIHFMN